MKTNWTETRLEDITTILGDGLHGTPQYTENGEYHFINGNNLDNGKIVITEQTKSTSKEEYLKYKKNLNDRTILVSINGTLGNVAFYSNEKVILGKSACYFNLKEGINKRYIGYVLRDRHFQEYISNFASGSTIKNVSLRMMRDYSLKLPPIQVQNKISEILGAIDDRITLNQRTNETLEQIAQTLFKSWFVDFDPVKAKAEGRKPAGMDDATATLFPDSFEESELGLIPKGWTVKRLSDVVESTGGGTPSRANDSFWNGEIPWFSVKDTPANSDIFVINTSEKITEDGLKNSSTKLLRTGTTI
ncbi:MAG: restriction endonuclease subunit S, partial [Fibrobacteres bacterium]|nr:restriction endonuclease subunit S [Fibrobacterota bacterium]